MMPKRTKLLFSILLNCAIVLGLAAPAWAGYPAPASQTAGTLATVVSEDFESVPLGALGAPWTITSAGGGSVSVINTADHGHVLRLRGRTTEGSFLIATLPFNSGSTEITTQVDIRPSTGSAFIWTLNGAGSSIGRRRIRLEQWPGTTILDAQTSPSGTTNCGTLAQDAWSTVTLNVHTGSGTFDVLINGAPTTCTGVVAGIQPPFNSVSVMDASNAGWGGNVLFDNILVTTP